MTARPCTAEHAELLPRREEGGNPVCRRVFDLPPPPGSAATQWRARQRSRARSCSRFTLLGRLPAALPPSAAHDAAKRYMLNAAGLEMINHVEHTELTVVTKTYCIRLN